MKCNKTPCVFSLAALDAVSDAVIGLNEDKHICYLNSAAEKLLHSTREQLLGQAADDLFEIIPDPASPLSGAADIGKHFEAYSRNSQRMVLVTGVRRRPVAVRRVELHSDTMDHVLVLHDRSAEMAIRRSISEQARKDSLTGLSNREEFDHCLNNLVEDADIGMNTHALLYIDLDQFKVVNDTCGHEAGDELLRVLGQLLNNTLQRGDIVGRLGGDEFGVLLCQVDSTEAQEIADRVRQAIDQVRFAWGTYSFAVRASIGVAMIDHHTRSPANAMRQADAACFAAKDRGRNRVHLFSASDKQLARQQGDMHWLSQINQALDDNRILIMQQPIVPLQKGQNKTMAEILLRLVTTDGKEISPGAFIPAAERYNLMPLLDRRVIQQVFQMLAENPSLTKDVKRYTINLSGLSITDPDFIDYILGEFESSGIDPKLICFELTETAAVASFSRAVRFMSLLREIGCEFALDDFGSGMSSFGYLRELPVDYLKIDGMFMGNLALDPFHRAIVRSITEVNRTVGMQTIAEHVDSHAAVDLLREMDVDFVQGFLIQRPQPLLVQEAA